MSKLTQHFDLIAIVVLALVLGVAQGSRYTAKAGSRLIHLHDADQKFARMIVHYR